MVAKEAASEGQDVCWLEVRSIESEVTSEGWDVVGRARVSRRWGAEEYKGCDAGTAPTAEDELTRGEMSETAGATNVAPDGRRWPGMALAGAVDCTATAEE